VEVPVPVTSVVGAGRAVSAVASDGEGHSVGLEADYKDMEAVASVEEGRNVDIGIRLSVEGRIEQCVVAGGFALLVLHSGLSLYRSFHRNDEAQ
jgi:hypothetical protein